MTAKSQNPKKGKKKPKRKSKKEMSLWERVQLLEPIQGLSQFLEEHELLSPEQRRKNIEVARKKGLIKATVSY